MIGSLNLSPEFDSGVKSYTATIESNVDISGITATPTDNSSDIAIDADGTEVENGGTITWNTGDNLVTITVTNGELSDIYTVVVTKEAE
ncbi:hypothetical protein FACS1894132_11100 [Clostridia bacterium]|nr:hypothetical protein FACS1894132_11100 [Clostridia bacterium]